MSTLPREVVCPLVGRSLNNKNTHKIINKLLYNAIHMIYEIYHTTYHGITVESGTDSAMRLVYQNMGGEHFRPLPQLIRGHVLSATDFMLEVSSD